MVKDCFTGQSPGKAISIPAAPDVQRSQTKSKPWAGRRLSICYLEMPEMRFVNDSSYLVVDCPC